MSDAKNEFDAGVASVANVAGSANDANAAKKLGLKISHIGVNPQSDMEFEKVTKLFSLILGVDVMQTPVSCMVGTQVEVMKPVGRGKNGHIAIHANDIAAAESFMQDCGFSIDETSRRLAKDGTTHLVYLAESICGFDIHLTSD